MNTEPIFGRLLHEAGGFLHHHHGRQAATNQEGNHMNLTQFHQDVADFTDGVEGWVSDVKGKLPGYAAAFAKLDSSPIVQEVLALGGLVLPPGTEQAIAAAVRAAGAAAAALRDAQAAVTPAEPAQPAEPAEPVPAS